VPTLPSTGMRWITGGTFRMGADQSYPEEAPVHTVAVGDFWIDAQRRWCTCPVQGEMIPIPSGYAMTGWRRAESGLGGRILVFGLGH
jgi:Sulfatase-modifying factor enzyme 1